MQSFIARQPIFDRSLEVFAYELLFRSGMENVFSGVDAEHATSKVMIDSMALFGEDDLTGGHPAFINFTEKLLVGGFAEVLPKESVVVEILETVEPTEDVLAACFILKEEGYTLALDDFVYHEKFEPLIKLADIIKVDFVEADKAERRRIVDRARQGGIKLLAEKVETNEELEEAMEAGYDYFQGYFFCRPSIVAGRDIPANKQSRFTILKEVHGPELNYSRLSRAILSDVALAYKLLRYINSAYFGFRREIESVKQALTLLGEQNSRAWLSLVLMTEMGEDKPHELLIAALVRAFFCQSLGNPRDPNQQNDLFLAGLLSTIDAFLDQPMDRIMADLPIPDRIKEAITGYQGRSGMALKLAQTYEQGDWDDVLELASQFGLDEPGVLQGYLNAIESTQKLTLNI